VKASWAWASGSWPCFIQSISSIIRFMKNIFSNKNILLFDRVMRPLLPPCSVPYRWPSWRACCWHSKSNFFPTFLQNQYNSPMHLFCLKQETTWAPEVNRRFSPSILVTHPTPCFCRMLIQWYCTL
jgi:hypothetical protein